MHGSVVYWNVVLLARQDGQQVAHHGHTHDISLTGATVFIENMVNCHEPVVLAVRIPKGNRIQDWKEIEIKCRNAIGVSEEDHFRVPLQFMSFTGNGREALEAALRERGGNLTAGGE